MRLLLCGGGSGEQTVEAKKIFNEIIDHTKPLLYAPRLDENECPYDGFLEWITKELSDVDIPNIEMVRSFEEFAAKDYNNYCAIFIGGGNTYKLLKGIKDSGAFSKINEYINNDGIVYGGSAGAIIFGYDINSCLAMYTNDVNLLDTKGFNVLNGKSLFAHYTNEHTEEDYIKYKNYLLNYSLNNEDVIALSEEDTIFVNGDKNIIIGDKPYYVFENGLEIIKKQDNVKDDFICNKMF